MSVSPYTAQELASLLEGNGTVDNARLNATPKSVQTQALNLAKATNSGAGSGGAFAGGTVGASTPGVTATEAGDIVSFAMPNQMSDLNVPASIQTQAGANGATDMTFANAVQWLHDIQGTAELARIQEMLHNSGYLKGDKIPYGTLDSTTLTAWKQALADSVQASQSLTNIGGQPITVMGLLATGQGSNFVSVMSGLELKYQDAINSAESVSAPQLTLTDPNQVAQAFASAMEDVGNGAPSKAQVAKFVTAFHNAQVGAVQDAYETQKGDYLKGAQQDLGRLDTVISGAPQAPTGPQMDGPPVPGGGPMPSLAPTAQQRAAYEQAMSTYQSALGGEGPVDVATKAMPNLDAEAMAAAKNANPAQYYATQASYYGALVHDLLAGNIVGQTAPTAPSQDAPGGAILTSPVLAGVA